MSWETRYTTTLYFSRQTYDTKCSVEDALEDIRESINYYENKLRHLTTITEPKKFCNEEDDPMLWLQSETNECLTTLSDLYVDQFKLQCLLNGWESCHTKDGDPIHPPKEFCNADEYQNECSYIDGDFILTKEEKQKDREELGYVE